MGSEFQNFGSAFAFESLIELSNFEIQNLVKSSWEFLSWFDFLVNERLQPHNRITNPQPTIFDVTQLTISSQVDNRSKPQPTNGWKWYIFTWK